MLLLRGNRGRLGEDVWTATAELDAEAEALLAALTDPDAIAAWAPVRFEVEGLAGERLSIGSRERVTGALAGMRATFDVEVHAADLDGLELTARGPVDMDVRYDFYAGGNGVIVDASVRLTARRGLQGQILGAAICALLNAGALRSALRRIEPSVAPQFDADLVAA